MQRSFLANLGYENLETAITVKVVIELRGLSRKTLSTFLFKPNMDWGTLDAIQKVTLAYYESGGDLRATAWAAADEYVGSIGGFGQVFGDLTP